MPLDRIGDHQMSWAQWFADSPAPGVMAAHWLERRHMQHHTRRWNRDHSDELQSSWMNGTGMIVWDAVFGSWVGWNDRDASACGGWCASSGRSLTSSSTANGHHWSTSQRRHGQPACTCRGSPARMTPWTIVNRGVVDFDGPLIDAEAGGTVVDVTAGTAIDSPGSPIVVPARSIAGVLRADGELPPYVTDLLAAAGKDAHSSDSTFPARRPARVAVRRSTSGPRQPMRSS